MPLRGPDSRLRFRFNLDKAVEAIDLVAKHQRGITQYYLGKVCYFADKEHLLDYGRPITGDRYVAMEYGPVPSTIYDLLKEDYGLPDAVIDRLHERVTITKNGKYLHVVSKGADSFPHLSGSEKEYLILSLREHGRMPFEDLKEKSHDDAWAEAWDRPGTSNEMNLLNWLKELNEGDREAARRQLTDRRVRTV